MRYLRRDEDAPGTRMPALLRRQARELRADLAIVRRDWDPRTARILRHAVLGYHLRLATGQIRADVGPDGRLRAIPLRAGRVELTALLRPTLSDLFVLREIFVHQLYRYPYERTGTVRRVLDLGSNIGMSPLYFSLRFPEAQVVCVEPVAENVNLLRRNRDANALPWTVEPVAIAATSGHTTLYPNRWWASSSTTKHVAAARVDQAHRPERRLVCAPVQVPTLSVPELLDRAGWDRVDVVKMDIEGAEEDVLLDAEPDWLHRVSTLALDIHGKYVPREAILTRLARYGFWPAEGEGPHAAIFVRAPSRRPVVVPNPRDRTTAPARVSSSRAHQLASTRPKAVLFDAGLTLIHASGEILLAEMAADGVNVGGLTGSDATRALVLAAEARHVPLPAHLTGTEKVAAAMVRLLGLTDPAAVPACLRALARTDLYQDLDPDAVVALTALSEGGIRLGVVSNSAGTVRDDLAAFDLLRFFEVVIDSTVVGAEKPAARPFHAALCQLGLPGETCWYVGDGLYNDVLGAQAAGYARGVLLDRFDNFPVLPGITRIRRLTELAPLLDLSASTDITMPPGPTAPADPTPSVSMRQGPNAAKGENE